MNLVSLLSPLLAICLTVAEPADNIMSPEQKAALAAVDVRLAGVEALAAKIDDPKYKAEVARQIGDLKKRRLAIEKNFDPGLYEVLMHDYEVCTVWATNAADHVRMGKAFDVARGLLDAESAGVAGDLRLVEWRRAAQAWTDHFREELMTPAPGTVCGPAEYETDDSVVERKSKTASKKTAKKAAKGKPTAKSAKKSGAKKPAGKPRDVRSAGTGGSGGSKDDASSTNFYGCAAAPGGGSGGGLLVGLAVMLLARRRRAA